MGPCDADAAAKALEARKQQPFPILGSSPSEIDKVSVRAPIRGDPFPRCPWTGAVYVLMIATYVVPTALIVHVLAYFPSPYLIQLVMLPVMTMVLIGVGMSVCLHRYFSHQAFKTTRAFQFVLGIIACLAYQAGPLWWAGKHNRHHRHCDKEEDPHSMLQSRSFFYSYLYWTLAPKEYHYDLEYIPPRFRNCPELWWLDRACLAPPILAFLAAWHMFGYQSAVLCLVAPMINARLMTLLFNIYFHPCGRVLRALMRPFGSKKQQIKDHSDHTQAAAAPPRALTGTQCRAVDDTRSMYKVPGMLASLVGEAHHMDHHKYPNKMRRPGLDFPYHISIRWWLALGLIWE